LRIYNSDQERFIECLDNARSYAEVWKIVQETAQYALGKRRNCMMLFLDDLPLQLGAYYPVGTNNIVLNRTLVDVVETQFNDKPTKNALVYNLLLHEYLHACGQISEVVVRREVVAVAQKSFGEKHRVTLLARKSPWALLKDLPWETMVTSKRCMEIVGDFEKTDKYIV
jgi:hypothetical protein